MSVNCSPGVAVARAHADHANHIQPRVVGALRASLAGRRGLILLQGFADDVGARLSLPLRQRVQGPSAFGPSLTVNAITHLACNTYKYYTSARPVPA